MQFVYYIPNVLVQIVTMVFLGSAKFPLQLITASSADAIASAQALRITRNLWKAGQWRQSESVLPLIEDKKYVSEDIRIVERGMV
jgi:hypothetical protein